MRNVETTFKHFAEYETYKGIELDFLLAIISEGFDDSLTEWEKEAATDFRDILRYSAGNSTLQPKNFKTHEGFDTEWLDTLIEEGFDDTISEMEKLAAKSWHKQKKHVAQLDEAKNDTHCPKLIQRAKELYKKHKGDISEIRKHYGKKVKKAGYYDNHGKRPVNNDHAHTQRKNNTVSFHVGNNHGHTSASKLHIYDSDGTARAYTTSYDSEHEHAINRKKRSTKKLNKLLGKINES